MFDNVNLQLLSIKVLDSLRVITYMTIKQCSNYNKQNRMVWITVYIVQPFIGLGCLSSAILAS